MSTGWRLFFVWALATACLTLVARGVLHAWPNVLFVTALALVAWDMSLGSLIVARGSKRHPPTRGAPLAVSVLIAAYNEEKSIAATVKNVLQQRGEFEIIVGDDGSHDQTAAIVAKDFANHPRVHLSLGEHQGKAATLNRMLALAHHPLVVTIDADTALLPSAIENLAESFADPARIATAATILVDNTPNWLTRYQYTEYIRMDHVAAAWRELGALEQVPGACAAFRTEALRAVGGFPTDSITEDYEVVYRLYDRAWRDGRKIIVGYQEDAIALTHAPQTLGGFFRQRRRWFAGFLLTLFRFRHLIGSKGRFGRLKLPLKVIDALIPLAGFYFLATILDAAKSPFAWALFAVRWLWDAGCYAVILRYAEKRLPLQRSATMWIYALTEALTFAWLRYFVALFAYPFALKKTRDWLPSRVS